MNNKAKWIIEEFPVRHGIETPVEWLVANIECLIGDLDEELETPASAVALAKIEHLEAVIDGRDMEIERLQNECNDPK